MEGRGVVLSASAVAVALGVCASAALAVPPDVDDAPRRREAMPGGGGGGSGSGGSGSPAPAQVPVQPVDASGGGVSGAPVSSESGVEPARVGCAAPAVPFPHPLVTEILFAVPSGGAGDANKDGARSVNGDEFVELINPHAEPIALTGYTLTDGTTGISQFRFTFPKFELPPGGVVVVFNGCQAKWGAGALVGDSEAAPAGASGDFGGAYVFTARVNKSGVAFSNESDSVVLRSPGGVVVQRLTWGAEGEPASGGAGTRALLEESVPGITGASAQRDHCGAGGSFSDHKSVGAPDPYRLCSPGWFPSSAGEAAQAPGAADAGAER